MRALLIAVLMLVGCSSAPVNPLVPGDAEPEWSPMIVVGPHTTAKVCEGQLLYETIKLPLGYGAALAEATRIWNTSMGYTAIRQVRVDERANIWIVGEQVWTSPPQPMKPLPAQVLGLTKWESGIGSGCARSLAIILDDDGPLTDMPHDVVLHVIAHEIGHAFGLAHLPDHSPQCAEDVGRKNLMCRYTMDHAPGERCMLNCLQAQALAAAYPMAVLTTDCE